MDFLTVLSTGAAGAAKMLGEAALGASLTFGDGDLPPEWHHPCEISDSILSANTTTPVVTHTLVVFKDPGTWGQAGTRR